MSKTIAQLSEELSAVRAELAAVKAERDSFVESVQEEIAHEKQLLQLQAEGNEKIRQDELAVATEGYESLFEKAQAIYQTQAVIEPKLLGVAGQVSRDGIMNVLQEIFGDEL